MFKVNINQEKCSGCGECVKVCPCEIIVLDEGVAQVEGYGCMECQSCVVVCPAEAIFITED